MARTLPPLPDPRVPMFINESMSPTWRGFWQNILLYLSDAGADIAALQAVVTALTTAVSQAPNGPALQASASYANDAAAAAGGVLVGEFYRNGSVVQLRIV